MTSSLQNDDQSPDNDTTESLIRCENVKQLVKFGGGELTILKGINLNIKCAESLAIVGESGSGKSTLLGMLAGLDTPSHGEIFINGQEITQLDEEQRSEIRAKHVAFVFQNFQLLPSLTALENVLLPLEVQGKDGAMERAKDILNKVGLSGREQHYPKQLSGGEQQRVAIARAFASDSDILFADEPTGNLDTKTGLHIQDLLFELNREFKTTLILVTHDMKLAKRCDRQIELSGGEVING